MFEYIIRSKLVSLVVPHAYCFSYNGATNNSTSKTRNHPVAKARVYTGKTDHTLKPNEKIVHVVRHAEGYHNVAGKIDPAFGYLRESLEDAELTDNGINQCKTLAKKVENAVKNVEMIVVSPLNRTMQTVKYSFPYLLGKVPCIAVEEIRETTGMHPCDRRLSIRHHKPRYEFVNFDEVSHDDDPLYYQYMLREPQVHVIQRAMKFIEWLKHRPEKEIIIVSHGNYLHTFFSKVIVPNDPNDKTYFNNCEMRSFIVAFHQQEEEEGKEKGEESNLNHATNSKEVKKSKHQA